MLALELAGSFAAGLFTATLGMFMLARRKLKQMLRPDLRPRR